MLHHFQLGKIGQEHGDGQDDDDGAGQEAHGGGYGAPDAVAFFTDEGGNIEGDDARGERLFDRMIRAQLGWLPPEWRRQYA